MWYAGVIKYLRTEALEKSDCRKCGDCCVGCIFLEFDEVQELYSCLIYENKNRLPLAYYKVNEDDDSLGMMEIIENIIGGESELCHKYHCIRMIGKVSESRKSLSYVKAMEARESIPNFQVLVDILNGNVREVM